MTHFEFAQRLVGEIPERAGTIENHPFIVWCHESCTMQNTNDEIPWCSSFVNRINWHFRLPRTKSRMARSWLGIGTAINLPDAKVGDIVILSRGAPPSGHCGYYAGLSGGNILVLGGNQGNNVSIEPFVIDRLLGIRRVTA